MRKKHIFLKELLLYIINNISMVLEIIIFQIFLYFESDVQKYFPEPQPHSAS